MTKMIELKRLAAVAMLCGFAALLTGCLLSPGKFDSRLELYRDNTFSFTYSGELFLVSPDDMGNMGGDTTAEFAPMPCYDEQGDMRDCTGSEIADQRAEWEANQPDEPSSAQDPQQAAVMGAMMGGFDPSDPEAAEQLAEQLRKQAGWNKVVHLGDGKFEVEFAISGDLSHDFLFPTIEELNLPTYFVTMHRRSNESIKINAPGYSAEGAPMAGMMGGIGALAGNGETEDGKEIPQMAGTFTIVTDGEILANNTDEGARIEGTKRVLEWTVDAGTQDAPMALIQLGS